MCISPPIMKSQGKKLSKREGDASFEDFHGKGYLTEAILNYIALLGWGAANDREFFTLAELEREFDLDGLNRSPAIFDPAKLRAFNAHYVRSLSPERFHELVLPYYPTALVQAGIDLGLLSRTIQSRVEVLSEVAELTSFLTALPDYDIEWFTNKKAKTDRESSRRSILLLKEKLGGLGEWNHASLEAAVGDLVATSQAKNSQFFWPLRIAVTGTEVTPCGGIEAADLLGKEEALRRLDLALSRL